MSNSRQNFRVRPSPAPRKAEAAHPIPCYVFSVIGTVCAFNTYSILTAGQTPHKKADFHTCDCQIRRSLPESTHPCKRQNRRNKPNHKQHESNRRAASPPFSPITGGISVWKPDIRKIQCPLANLLPFPDRSNHDVPSQVAGNDRENARFQGTNAAESITCCGIQHFVLGPSLNCGPSLK